MVFDFFNKYSHKIVSNKELIKKINKFPRKEKIILCHGVFDVVHPGHVRHLAFAKTKAKILVVSITCDKHIKKGIYRPHIPEKIRASNLAAFEMVDYVLIDSNATPLKNLLSLKPDFFGKGFEYSSVGLPKATQEEKKIVESYGGKLIFTPGDVVFSSSKFLNQSLPNLQFEKLISLMNHNNIKFDNLRDILKKFKTKKIHILGDTIIDTYTRGSFIGGQTKTPTFSILYENHENYVGGAGIVAQHLSSAGAKVTFSTMLGDDQLKKLALKTLIKSKIKTNAYIDKDRPTTNKNLIISGDYRLLKLDTLDNTPIDNEKINFFVKSIKKIKSDAVIFSDFRHGIFHKMSIDLLTKAIPKGMFSVADTQVASRWGNVTEFKNFNLITPNEREARFALADQDSTVGRLSTLLEKSCNYENLILKLGSKGIFCATKNQKLKSTFFSLDSFATTVKDPVGAGDALLAYSTLSFLVSKSLVSSSIIGSFAAACECEFDGNIPISIKNILKKIDEVEKKTIL